MPGRSTGRSAMANGNIMPWCAVMIDTTVDNRLIPATAGAKAVGIAGKGTRYAPWTPLNDGFMAVAGEVFNYWGEAEENVPALLGGTVASGDNLKVAGTLTINTQSVVGSLITAGSGDLTVAIARMSGAAGDIIPVDVVISNVP